MSNKFSKSLKSALEKSQVEQMQLAKMLDVTPTQVSRWINGHSTPRPNMLSKIQEVLPNLTLDNVEYVDNYSNSLEAITVQEQRKTIDRLLRIIENQNMMLAKPWGLSELLGSLSSTRTTLSPNKY